MWELDHGEQKLGICVLLSNMSHESKLRPKLPLHASVIVEIGLRKLDMLKFLHNLAK